MPEVPETVFVSCPHNNCGHDLTVEWVQDDDYDEGGYFIAPRKCPISGRMMPGDEDEIIRLARAQVGLLERDS